MIALDDPGTLQLSDPGEAGAGRERDPLGERLVGESTVGLQIARILRSIRSSVKAAFIGSLNRRIHGAGQGLRCHLRWVSGYTHWIASREGSGGKHQLWRHIMTRKERIEGAWFLAVIVVGMPAAVIAAKAIAS